MPRNSQTAKTTPVEDNVSVKTAKTTPVAEEMPQWVKNPIQKEARLKKTCERSLNC